MNIVTSVMQVLTPMIAGRLAAALGISPALATTAIGALVPAILAAFTGKASTPAGASALSSVLKAQDPTALGSLAGLLEGPGTASLVQSGTDALSSLLGGSAPSALATAAAKFTGMESSAASSLVGLLTPVVLGSLAQSQKQSGLDADGLAKLLQDQVPNISAALPPGFAGLLGGSGLLDKVPYVARPAPAGPVPSTPIPKAPSFDWLPYAAGIAAALVLYALLARPAAPPVPAPGDKATVSPVATAQAEALRQAQSLVTALTSTLGNIKDSATAQAAVPDLNKATSAIDSLQSLAALLPPEARAPVTQAVAIALSPLLALVSKALAIPGVDATLKPLLDPMVTKLTALAKT